MACYLLELECIGHDTIQMCRSFDRLCRDLGFRSGEGSGMGSLAPWVAEILDVDPRWGFKRQFLQYQVDYSRANSVGSRGVRYVFALYPERVYEVKEHCTWRKSRRYFCALDEDGNLIEISKEQVIRWLRTSSDRSGSMS